MSDEIPDEIPAGYRQGIISAITVLLGFSLLFLRYWTFEAPGTWTAAALGAQALLVISVLVQLWALWRSLQVADNRPAVYARTLRVFMASILLLIVSVAAAAFEATGILGGGP